MIGVLSPIKSEKKGGVDRSVNEEIFLSCIKTRE
jgi:hypothetical protein